LIASVVEFPIVENYFPETLMYCVMS